MTPPAGAASPEIRSTSRLSGIAIERSKQIFEINIERCAAPIKATPGSLRGQADSITPGVRYDSTCIFSLDTRDGLVSIREYSGTGNGHSAVVAGVNFERAVS
ncbi:hypothetical protein [Mycobacterium leprae]|nr:hypothetical protein [Mycobacterium leprae]